VVAGTGVGVVVLPVDVGGAIIAAVNISVAVGTAGVEALTVVSTGTIGAIVEVLVVGATAGVVRGGAVAAVVGGAVGRAGGRSAIACRAVASGAIACCTVAGGAIAGGAGGIICRAGRIIGGTGGVVVGVGVVPVSSSHFGDVWSTSFEAGFERYYSSWILKI
jgi:hypothetical protein